MRKFTKVSNVLRRLRKEKGITQKTLSEETGLPLGTIKQYESGTRQPNFINALKLVHYYNIDFSCLPFEADYRHKVK